MEKLTKKQQGFVKDYLETGNGTQSALNNYDTDKPTVANAIAVENLQKPSIREYLESKSIVAVENIYKLANEAENEAVRLSANKDILDRGGYKPIDRTVNLNIDAEVTPELIDKAKDFDEWFNKNL